jgi:peptidoglycan/LPS O-acetylase OafA/YrhL
LLIYLAAVTTTYHLPPTFSYRPDIDGLRAVAVLAVVFFHLGIVSLEGGFLGVDMFFVISGYLITSIIEPKIRKGQFSFKDFYLKRIRRLIPPALVTVAATFGAAAFILGPEDFMGMARSAIAAVFSVSNILFFTQAGYWDTTSELKPLLHTWSLGLEEQFYLFWPLLVYAFMKLMPRANLVWAFALATVIGLITSEWMLRANPSAAFFLLPARFFEFSMGAVFAFTGRSALWLRIGKYHVRLTLGVVGLLTLLATICLYNGTRPFPGINAVIPCLATGALILSGAGPKPALGGLLSNPVMTWLGKVSYSLYLVHWPVVSLIRHKVGVHLTPAHQVIAAALMFVLTLVLYYGVEQRFSSRAGQNTAVLGRGKGSSRIRLANGPFALRTGLAALLLSVVCAHAAATSGWTWRFPGLVLSPEQIQSGKSARLQLLSKVCRIDNFPDGRNCRGTAKYTLLVFGNSHESDGLNFIHAIYSDNSDVEIVTFGETNRCDTTQDDAGLYVSPHETCAGRVARVQTPGFARSIDVVLYSARQPFHANKKMPLDVFTRMKAANPALKLVTLGGYINTKVACSNLINKAGSREACVDPVNTTYTPDMDSLAKYWSDFQSMTDLYIDRGALLCGGDTPKSCESQTPDGVPMMYDQHHLSFDFAQYAGRKYAAENPSFLEALFTPSEGK